MSEAQGRELRMISGWDNEDPEMRGIFLARGPGKIKFNCHRLFKFQHLNLITRADQ